MDWSVESRTPGREVSRTAESTAWFHEREKFCTAETRGRLKALDGQIVRAVHAEPRFCGVGVNVLG